MIGIKNKFSKGFTLIELIVVMAVFLIIIGTAISIFISIVQHQRRILSQQELLNQTSYFIEYLTKGLRMAAKDLTGVCLGEAGYVYKLEDFDPSSKKWKAIKFINRSDNDACIKICLDDSDPKNIVIREIKNGATWNCASGTNITSTKIEINSLWFVLDGNTDNELAPPDDDITQPKATVFLDVRFKGVSEDQPSTKVQTTVSQRDLNR